MIHRWSPDAAAGTHARRYAVLAVFAFNFSGIAAWLLACRHPATDKARVEAFR